MRSSGLTLALLAVGVFTPNGTRGDEKTPAIQNPLEAILAGRPLPGPATAPANDPRPEVIPTPPTNVRPLDDNRHAFLAPPVVRGLGYFLAKQWPKAIEQFNEVLRLHQDWAAVYNLRAWANMQNGAFDQAIADFSASLRLNPQVASILHFRGCTYSLKNDWANAIADFSEAIRLAPNHPSSRASRGYAFVAQGEFDKAIDDLTKAIELDPKNAGAYGDRASVFFVKGDMDRALADASEATRLRPDDHRFYGCRGSVYAQREAFDRAIADFSEGLRLAPTDSALLEYRAQVYVWKHQCDRAIADLNQALKYDPASAGAYDLRGIAYGQKKDYERAVGDFTLALLLCFDNKPIHISSSEPSVGATLRLDKKFSFGTQKRDVYAHRGAIYLCQESYDRALSDYNQAILLDSGDAPAHSGRAMAFFGKKDPAAALADCAEALRLDPKDTIAHAVRGLVYLHLTRQYDQAVASFTEAIRLSPTNASLWFYRLQAYAANRDYLHAMLDLAGAVLIDPTSVRFTFFISRRPANLVSASAQ